MTRRRVGDPNPRGRLDRLQGPFRLRAGFDAPGEVDLDTALALVATDWERQVADGGVGNAVVYKYLTLLRGFFTVLSRQGVTLVEEVTANHVLSWCRMRAPQSNAEPNENTMRVRRSAARAFFEACACLGITDVNPAKTIEFPRRSDRHVSAFADNDIRQLKRISGSVIGDTRTPCALALVMSGASTQEMVFVTVDDVDLVGDRFWAHGGGYRSRDRWIPFQDKWCTDTIAARVSELRETYGENAGGVWLIYKPHPSQPTPTRQASAGIALMTRLMRKARLHQPGVTRVESIREWLAAKVFAQTGSVEQVAIRLGYASLDAAAHLVGYDWIAAHSVGGTAPAHRQGGGDR